MWLPYYYFISYKHLGAMNFPFQMSLLERLQHIPLSRILFVQTARVVINTQLKRNPRLPPYLFSKGEMHGSFELMSLSPAEYN
jgi:hypothetical protein